MSTLVETTQSYVKKRFLTEMLPETGPQYRYAHTLRVAELGRRIARAEGLDEEMLVLGCLLHDIGYVQCTSHADYDDHGLLSARIAADFLVKQGYDPAKTESICYGIRIHTLAEEKRPRSPTVLEASVDNADDLDRFDAYRLYDWLRWLKPEQLSCAELQAQAGRWLQRCRRYAQMRLATPTANRLWQERLALYTDYFTRLCGQMDTTLAWDPCPERLDPPQRADGDR